MARAGCRYGHPAYHCQRALRARDHHRAAHVDTDRGRNPRGYASTPTGCRLGAERSLVQIQYWPWCGCGCDGIGFGIRCASCRPASPSSDDAVGRTGFGFLTGLTVAVSDAAGHRGAVLCGIDPVSPTSRTAVTRVSGLNRTGGSCGLVPATALTNVGAHPATRSPSALAEPCRCRSSTRAAAGAGE
jgi:hypothetical protein